MRQISSYHKVKSLPLIYGTLEHINQTINTNSNYCAIIYQMVYTYTDCAHKITTTKRYVITSQ